MAVDAFDPTEQTVRVSEAALAHFRKQLQSDDNGARAVRLSVKQSGCTGYAYVVDLVSEPNPDDVTVPLDEDLTLLIDQQSLSMVAGTEIDLVQEGVNRQLRFLNPNASDYCGCGESFSIN